EIPEDLIEEVARLYGYSKLPDTMPKYAAAQTNISETYQSLDPLNMRLIDIGYHETINYSLIDPKFDEFFFSDRCIAIQNPI
ncbi:phenylalanine--tRNA ligase subunit beta, partial [Francisella tularensis subsp. holarctica]|nr:phenylalanine--tRNA ligase subunit beta [Francisella tularensis subsp. holarctica]